MTQTWEVGCAVGPSTSARLSSTYQLSMAVYMQGRLTTEKRKTLQEDENIGGSERIRAVLAVVVERRHYKYHR
jgi:hypothetical protein